MVPIEHVVGLAGLLFLIGAVGMLVRRHLVVLLMCVQLMWAAGTLAIVGFARLHGDENGHVFALLAIVAAAVQVAIGLGVLVAFFRGRESVDVEEASELKW